MDHGDDSFLQIGGGIDEKAYYKSIIDDAIAKAEMEPFQERRLNEVQSMNMEDEMDIEEEYKLAMEEVLQKEDILKQVTQVTSVLFERNEELLEKYEAEKKALEVYKQDNVDQESRFQALLDDLDEKGHKIDCLIQDQNQLQLDLRESNNTSEQLREKVRDWQDRERHAQDQKLKLEETLFRKEQEVERIRAELAEKIPSMQQEIDELREEKQREFEQKTEAERAINKFTKEIEGFKLKEKTILMQQDKYIKRSKTQARDLKAKDEMIVTLQAEVERMKVEAEQAKMQQLARQASTVRDVDYELDQIEQDQFNEDQQEDDGYNQPYDQPVVESVETHDQQNDFVNELNELEQLGNDNFNMDEPAVDYVETNVYDQRKSRQVAPDVLAKLEGVGSKRPSGAGGSFVNQFGGSFVVPQEPVPKVELVDSETQTDEPEPKEMFEIETQTDQPQTSSIRIQTEKLQVSVGTTQTLQVQTSTESCQTERKTESNAGVQVRPITQVIEVQTDLIADDFYGEEIEEESEEQQSEVSEEQIAKNDLISETRRTMPLTTRAGIQKKIEFQDVPELQPVKEPTENSISNASTLTRATTIKQDSGKVKDKINQDYMKNRDPMKEFFQLTVQSVKMNSPHFNIIALLQADKLYERALTEAIPFNQWWPWLEKTINKEVLSQLVRRNEDEKPGQRRPGQNDPRRASFRRNQMSFRSQTQMSFRKEPPRKLSKKEQLKKSLGTYLSKWQSKDDNKTIKEEAKEEESSKPVKSSFASNSTPKKTVRIGPPSHF